MDMDKIYLPTFYLHTHLYAPPEGIGRYTHRVFPHIPTYAPPMRPRHTAPGALEALYVRPCAPTWALPYAGIPHGP